MRYMDSKEKREKMVQSGKRFEKVVASYLFGTPNSCILLNRQFMDRRIGKAMECDLLFITPYKIYCVECKNFNGYIAGEMFDREWRFASSSKKGRVQNPHLLNKRRIRLARGCFYSKGLNPPKIENYIVVPDRCKIHVTDCNVYTISSFIEMVSTDSYMSSEIYNVKSFENFIMKVSTVRE